MKKPAANPETDTASPELDEEEFLQGAKLVYQRLHEAWDAKDINFIANFTTKDVLRQIKVQAKQAPKKGKTEILHINANILEKKQIKDRVTVSVFYDVLLQEGKKGQGSRQVQEVWQFGKKATEPEAKWLLEEIQKVQ
jgi:predicted lipid-binding transport protein (Tim44 family)